MSDALSRWNDNFSDLPLFTDKDRDGNDAHTGTKQKMQVGMCYHVKVGQAQVVKSEYTGDIQVEVTYLCDGFHPKKQWMTLPMQETDLARDKDQVTWLSQRRMRDIESLYACAMPVKYALYDERRDSLDGTLWINFEGKQMGKDEFNARKLEIRHALTDLVTDLHNRLGATLREVEGTDLFLVQAENFKAPKYPYFNIYRTAPKNVPLYKDMTPPEQGYDIGGDTLVEEGLPF